MAEAERVLRGYVGGVGYRYDVMVGEVEAEVEDETEGDAEGGSEGKA